jgi:hypothetical protein
MARNPPAIRDCKSLSKLIDLSCQYRSFRYNDIARYKAGPQANWRSHLCPYAWFLHGNLLTKLFAKNYALWLAEGKKKIAL